MKFYNVQTGKPINIADSKIRYVTKTVNTKGNLGVRKMTFAKAKSPTGQKLSKIVSSKKIRKSCKGRKTMRRSPSGKRRCMKKKRSSKKRSGKKKSRSPKKRSGKKRSKIK